MRINVLAFAVLLAQLPPIVARAEDQVTRTPEAIEDFVVADGGGLLVFKLTGLGGLVLYDTAQKKISKIIKLPSDNFIYGAGGKTAVCYFPENNIVQSWDLKTYKKTKTKPNPMSGPILRILMGHSRGDVAFCRYSEGTDALDRAQCFLLDTGSLLTVLPDISTDNTSYRDDVRLRADGDLGHVTEWATSHSPSGVSILVRTGKGYELKDEHDSEGYLVPGDDGRVYTGTGKILSSDLTMSGQIKGQLLFPGIGGSLVLGVDDRGKITAYGAGTTTPIGPVGDFPDWPKDQDLDYRFRGNRNLDKLLVFNPLAGNIIFIPPTNDRIIQRSFDLKAALDKAGIDYLVVTSVPDCRAEPGKEWSYKVDTISNSASVNCKLELAPDGMKISKGGKLSWSVPKEFEGSEKVVVLLSNKANEQTWHSFEVVAHKSGK
ncbi:MAG: hypothetical protein VCA38_02840 [Roseibacillus sp.]